MLPFRRSASMTRCSAAASATSVLILLLVLVPLASPFATTPPRALSYRAATRAADEVAWTMMRAAEDDAEKGSPSSSSSSSSSTSSSATVSAAAAAAAAFSSSSSSSTAFPSSVPSLAWTAGSRRRALAAMSSALGAGALGVGVVGVAPSPASARLKGPASPDEMQRLVTGYTGLVYLLDNWDKETTKCNPECNRNPDAVRVYLGLRSMEHPLYQIDKVMQKAQDNIEDVDQLGDFIEAIESWSSCISESNAMAYTSSFGEYNPGGGKDVVEKFLVKAKEQVVLAKNQLKIIIDVLGLKTEAA